MVGKTQFIMVGKTCSKPSSWGGGGRHKAACPHLGTESLSQKRRWSRTLKPHSYIPMSASQTLCHKSFMTSQNSIIQLPSSSGYFQLLPVSHCQAKSQPTAVSARNRCGCLNQKNPIVRAFNMQGHIKVLGILFLGCLFSKGKVPYPQAFHTPQLCEA